MTHQQPDAVTLVAMCDIILTAARQLAAIPALPDTDQDPAIRCNASFVLGDLHTPHPWQPQPGMEPVHCPGGQAKPSTATDEEQTLRWARRESLLVLLTRMQRGRTLTEDEALTLRQHVESELRQNEQLHAGRKMWKAKGEEIERDRDRLAAMVDEYGEGARQLSEKLGEARDDLKREQARVRQLETAVRAALHLCGDQSGDVQVLLRATLDDAEQPATDLRAVLTEANRVVDMQREFIGILRRIVMTASGHREDEGVQHESCEGCGRDHMAELYDAIVAADKRYASAFPASADGPARPGRLPAQPAPKDAP